MSHGVVLPAPEPQPLSPADRSSMCSFAASLPDAHIEFAGAGTGRVLAMLTVADRRFLFERSPSGIRVRDIKERHSLAEAGTIERVLVDLRNRLLRPATGEVVPFGPEIRNRTEMPEITETPPTTRKGGDGPVILVVEDQSYSAQELEDLLGQAGYRPVLARDGTAALAALDAQPHPATVALVSLHLRGAISGREVVLRLRQQRPGLPVLVMTGHPPTAPEADLRGLGGPTVRLLKPIEPDRLLQRLGDIIANGGSG